MLIFRKKDGVHITFFSLRMPLRRYLSAFLLPLRFGLLPFLFALVFLGGPQSMQLTFLVVGILWTSFHVYYFEGGVAFMAFFGLGLVSLSIMAYAVLAEYEFNVLGATLFHLAINLTSALYASLILNLNLPLMVTYGVAAALAAALVVFTRRNLFF
jgi:hypothetical protein